MAVLTGTRAKRNAWIEWLDHCRGGKFTNQLFFGKTIGGVPDVWADAIVALERAQRAGGYTPRSAWAYNFRGIGGATCTCSNFGRCSLHGNGIAIDQDPRLNPLIRTSTFRWSDTAFTPAQIALIEGIRNTKGEQMWSWGGRWNSIKDYMHFEANVDPGSTDVDWTTVPGETGETGVDMWLHGLDIGIKDEPSVDDPRVGTLQAMLVAEGYNLGNFGPNNDGVDGSAGNVSRSGFHQWKIDHGITSSTSAGSGKVGDYEAAAMLAGGGQDGEDGDDGIDGLDEAEVKALIKATKLVP